MPRVLERPPIVVAPVHEPTSGEGPGRRGLLWVAAAEASAAVVLAVVARAAPTGAVGVAAVAVAAALVAVRVVVERPAVGAVLGGLRVGALGALAVTAASGADLRVLAGLLALGALPVAAATAAGATAPGFANADREGLAAGLLLAAGAAGVAIVVAISAVGVVDAGPALGDLLPYFGAAMGLLGLAEVLAHHHQQMGFPGIPAVVGVLALAADAALLTGPGAAPDRGAQATLGACGILVTGLLVATAVSSPRAVAGVKVVVAEERAEGGPSFAPVAVAVFAAVAAVVRFAMPRPVWLDEAQLGRAAKGAWAGVASHAAASQPPIPRALTWASVHAFGANAVGLRLPELLAGVLLVPALYLAGTELYGRRVGMVAAAVGAIAPGMIWLASSAEPGMVAGLFAVLSLLAMVRAVRRRRPLDWVLFAAAGSALLASHPLGFVHVLLLHAAVGAVVWRHRRDGQPWRDLAAGWAVAGVVTVLAFAVVLTVAHGVGSTSTLPPLEYATAAAPGTQTVFGLVGTALSALLGFHPPDVTSRLFALWPVCILAAFLAFGRKWSLRGGLLVALAAAPFLVLLLADLFGRGFDPPFALVWAAPAVPLLVLGAARAVSTLGSTWPRTRTVALVVLAVLALAAVDQAVRVKPQRAFDLAAAEKAVGQAGPGDAVVYAPGSVGDLVAFEAHGAQVRSIDNTTAADVKGASHVYVVGAFGLDRGHSAGPTTDLVQALGRHRHLISRQQGRDTKVWVFA